MPQAAAQHDGPQASQQDRHEGVPQRTRRALRACAQRYAGGVASGKRATRPSQRLLRQRVLLTGAPPALPRQLQGILQDSWFLSGLPDGVLNFNDPFLLLEVRRCGSSAQAGCMRRWERALPFQGHGARLGLLELQALPHWRCSPSNWRSSWACTSTPAAQLMRLRLSRLRRPTRHSAPAPATGSWQLPAAPPLQPSPPGVRLPALPEDGGHLERG